MAIHPPVHARPGLIHRQHILVLAPLVAYLIIDDLHQRTYQELQARKSSNHSCSFKEPFDWNAASHSARKLSHQCRSYLAELLQAVEVGIDLDVAVQAVALQVVKLVDVEPIAPVGNNLRRAAFFVA